MSSATINRTRCKRDGICIKVCPMGILESDPDKFPRVADDKSTLCIKCGHCVAVCGQSAIAVEGIAPADCEDLHPELAVTPAQVSQYFKSRRSVRLYQNKEVPRTVLEQILHVARWAPTAKNCQVVEYLAIDSPPQLRHLLELTIDFLRPNPGLARLVAAHDAGRDLILRSAPLLLIAHAPTASYNPTVDCTIALAHVDLLANTFGLGGCWAGLLMAAVNGHAPLRAALDLPAGHGAYGALMLGYPKLQFARIPPRRELRVSWR
ncbi:MAG: nitroreductase family protein [Phycisphaerae bacterium]